MKLPSGDEIPRMGEQVTCVVERSMHAAHQIPYLVIGKISGFIVHNDRALIQVQQLGMSGLRLEYRIADEGVTWIRDWHYTRSAEGKALLVSHAMVFE